MSNLDHIEERKEDFFESYGVMLATLVFLLSGVFLVFAGDYLSDLDIVKTETVAQIPEPSILPSPAPAFAGDDLNIHELYWEENLYEENKMCEEE